MNDEYYDDEDHEHFGQCEECLQPILTPQYGDYCSWYCFIINNEEEEN